MKKLGTLVLTAALAGSLLTPALADQPELVIAPAPAAYPAVQADEEDCADCGAPC